MTCCDQIWTRSLFTQARQIQKVTSAIVLGLHYRQEIRTSYVCLYCVFQISFTCTLSLPYPSVYISATPRALFDRS